MGDVVYGVGGYIPGKTMGEQGAAYAADAAAQPGFMLRSRLEDAQRTYDEGLQSGNQDFLDAILKAKTSKLDVSSALYKQRVDQNMADRKMRLDQFNEDRNYWLKMQAYYQSVGKMKLAKDAEKRARASEQRYRYESMGRDADGNVAPGYVQLPNGTIVPRSQIRSDNKYRGLDVNGNLLPGYKRNKKGVIVKVGGGSGSSGLTPNAKADNLHSEQRQEDDID
jgi:hypothetical protein